MWKLKEERGLLRYSREINSLEVSDKLYLFLLSRCAQLMEPSVHTFLFIHLSFFFFFDVRLCRTSRKNHLHGRPRAWKRAKRDLQVRDETRQGDLFGFRHSSQCTKCMQIFYRRPFYIRLGFVSDPIFVYSVSLTRDTFHSKRIRSKATYKFPQGFLHE